MWRGGVEVDGVALAEGAAVFAVVEREFAVEDVEEFESGVHVRLGFVGRRDGNELSEVWVHVAIGNHVAEAFKVVGGIVGAGLRETYAFFAPVDAEHGLRLGLEEVREIFGKNHGDAGQIAQGGHDAAGFELRQKTGGQAGVAAEFDEAHGFFEAQAFDALANMFFGDEALSGLGVDLCLLGFFAAQDGGVSHGKPLGLGRPLLPRSKSILMLPKQEQTGNEEGAAVRGAGVDAECMSPTRYEEQKFLLSGASGLLGAGIRGVLLGSGAEILQLVRRQPAGPREVRWDPSAASPVGPSEELEGLAAAIHLSGANVAGHRWTSAYRREMWNSRVASTHALCGVLAGLRKPPRVVLAASATGIYGDRGDLVLDESSDGGSGFLADLCREWEGACEPAVQAGIRVVHLRFGVVLAREGGALRKMLPVFRLGLGGPMGTGRQWMSWIGMGDVMRAIRFLLESDVAGAVNLTSPHPVTNAEFTRILAQRLSRPALLRVPAFALRLAFGQMADEALLASARVMPGRLMEAGFEFAQPNLEEALGAVI